MLGDVVMEGHIEKIDGKNYLQFDKFDIKLTIQKSHLMLDGLFQQDPNLARATNEVLNDNSGVFLDTILPALENSLEEKFRNVANTICRHFTYEELFPVK